jgi:hypothetical protein
MPVPVQCACSPGSGSPLTVPHELEAQAQAGSLSASAAHWQAGTGMLQSPGPRAHWHWQFRVKIKLPRTCPPAGAWPASWHWLARPRRRPAGALRLARRAAVTVCPVICSTAALRVRVCARVASKTRCTRATGAVTGTSRRGCHTARCTLLRAAADSEAGLPRSMPLQCHCCALSPPGPGSSLSLRSSLVVWLARTLQRQDHPLTIIIQRACST